MPKTHDSTIPAPDKPPKTAHALKTGTITNMPDWYLYMVRCRDGSLYTGVATDVERRLAEHKRDNGPGSKYLRGRGPLELVFQKEIGSQSLALLAENRVKKLSKVKKEELVRFEKRIELILKQISP